MRPVGIVACCKSKLGHAAPAKDLYTGALFRLSVEWLLPRTDGWAILSALHGVLLPDTVVEPYEKTLVGAGRRAIKEWNALAGEDLRGMFPGRKFLAVCGSAYVGALAGLDYAEAFEGMPIGQKMHAIKEALSGQAA